MNYIECYNCNYDDKVPGVCKCDEISNLIKADGNEKTVADLTVLVRGLTHQLNEIDSTNKLVGKAQNYLRTKKL